MARPFPRRRLPPAPEGDALLQIIWASFIDLAPHYIAGLPKQVNPAWAIVKGGVHALGPPLWHLRSHQGARAHAAGLDASSPPRTTITVPEPAVRR